MSSEYVLPVLLCVVHVLIKLSTSLSALSVFDFCDARESVERHPQSTYPPSLP
jgi:hypothetical protein